ncbi:AAA family ATPase [Rhus yellows phytoplasma]|uniref:AAA+ ATPase domain-containing protein n=4 Tax=16SrI (Aster yellows group) TaxID=3042590 RepID=A0ABQ5PSD8_9MOLU|nr:hypothetical protein RHYP_2240 [Rhus yellows phytoplasma]
MNNLDKNFENYFKLSKLSKICFLIFLGFLVLGSNYNTAKADKEQLEAILGEWQEIYNKKNSTMIETIKKENNITLKIKKQALMVDNNKKLLSRALNTNGIINWKHTDTYDITYDNKGNVLSKRKFLQGHTEKNPNINWHHNDTYDITYDTNGNQIAKRHYKLESKQDNKVVDGTYYNAWRATYDKNDLKKALQNRFIDSLNKKIHSEKNPIIDQNTNTNPNDNTTTKSNLFPLQNEVKKLDQILKDLDSLNLKLLDFNRHSYDLQKRFEQISEQFVLNVQNKDTNLSLYNQYSNLKQDITVFLEQNFYLLETKITNLNKEKIGSLDKLVQRIFIKQEEIQTNYQNKYSQLSQEDKNNLQNRWNLETINKELDFKALLKHLFKFDNKIQIKKKYNEQIQTTNTTLSQTGENKIKLLEQVFLKDNLATLHKEMKNLNNELNSIITDSIPLYFKDFISLQDDTKEFLSNVKGAKETKKELKELFHFFKNPRQYQDMGIKVPKGYLFYGPPGTGKTFLTKELSKEAGVKFLYRSGSEFQKDQYVGTGVNEVMELFQEAKESNQPCIIFIDEIDAVGAKRSNNDEVYNKTLNQLLTELDGFNSKDRDPSKPIVVIGATNRPDILDKALLRP